LSYYIDANANETEYITGTFGLCEGMMALKKVIIMSMDGQLMKPN